MKLDKEEQKILDVYEKGRIKVKSPSKKELHMVKSIAESTFRKNRRITIRLYDHDYKGIQKKGNENGDTLSNINFRNDPSIC